MLHPLKKSIYCLMFTYTLLFHTPVPDPKNRFSYFIFQAREEAGEKGGVAEEYWGPLL